LKKKPEVKKLGAKSFRVDEKPNTKIKGVMGGSREKKKPASLTEIRLRDNRRRK